MKQPLTFLTSEKNYGNSLFAEECASSTDIKNVSLYSNEEHATRQKISWSCNLKESRDLEGKYMPTMLVDVNAGTLSKYHLQFLLWTLNERHSFDNIETVLFAETSLPFWKLF